MAIIKCKMYGGDLEIHEDSSACECEYCGTKQTVPKIDYKGINWFLNQRRGFSHLWPETINTDCLDEDTKGFLTCFLKMWDGYVQDGLLDSTKETKSILEMINSLLRMIGNNGCVLYLHLVRWGNELRSNPSQAWADGADHFIIEDINFLKVALKGVTAT